MPKSRKPRVLLVLHELSLTGAPKVALDVFEVLRDEFEVRIIALSGGPLEKRARQLAPTKVLIESARQNALMRQLENKLPRGVVMRIRGATLSASPWLRNFRPDLIYVNSAISLHSARYCRLPNAPVLLHVHELDSYLQPIFERFPHLIRKWPTSIVAVSEAVRKALLTNEVENSRITVIHEFIDAASITARFDANRTPDINRLVVGGAGTIGQRKGVDLWLKMGAFLIKNSIPGTIKLVWLGWRDTPEAHEMTLLSRSLGIEDYIEWVPQTSEPLPHFARFDLFALCSREDPCPLVVLEAMAMGVPVACFAGSGGAPDEVGETGIVAEEFSPIQMAQAILKLQNAPNRLQELGQQSRRRVMEHFSVEVQIPKIRAIIESLLSTQK